MNKSNPRSEFGFSPLKLASHRITAAMKQKNMSSQGGFSLLELLVILVIASIIAVFALTSLGRANENLDRQNLARHFKISLERARFDSVKRRATSTSGPTAMARVKILNDTSFTVTTDLNQNGAIGDGEFRTVSFSDRNGIKLLVDSGVTYPITIYFDRRGHSITVDGSGNPASKFIFCARGCTFLSANNSNSNQILVSPTGTVAMMGGDDSMISISDPSVTTVPNTSGVNPDVAVWNPSSAPTPTPSPTATPITIPTPTPVVVPSPTPTVVPSPTPTATPLSTPQPSPTVTPTPVPTATPLPTCTLNQRPGNPATCQCNSPWFVGRNGKCGP